MKGKIISRYKNSKYIKHETKRNILKRFIAVVILVIVYFVIISLRYGVQNGFMISILTWTLFVFCTPIADAGFLLDFPMRLITHIRMIHSEMMVWTIAFLLNLYSLTFMPGIYDKIIVLRLFKHILLNPFPYWLIILISACGTYISIYFGDEMIDVSKHKHRKKYIKHKSKYRVVLLVFLAVASFILYAFLISSFNFGISFI